MQCSRVYHLVTSHYDEETVLNASLLNDKYGHFPVRPSYKTFIISFTKMECELYITHAKISTKHTKTFPKSKESSVKAVGGEITNSI